ncbi:hypothetical protein Nepgr_021036 [Nepenthes gracilis]|uniref:RNase III domain-containing protein n=1 Tax=Nepenthes gracilis TaxID=150966 RepID=A0AAD3SXZ0_NEPGR|nr:hypothetical protein Nepgr_021036 [Nepenthes gracilis]
MKGYSKRDCWNLKAKNRKTGDEDNKEETIEVTEFVLAVQEEDEAVVYGGRVKAPKVLANIVESVVAAVYINYNFDLKALWQNRGRGGACSREAIQVLSSSRNSRRRTCHDGGRETSTQGSRKLSGLLDDLQSIGVRLSLSNSSRLYKLLQSVGPIRLLHLSGGNGGKVCAFAVSHLLG